MKLMATIDPKMIKRSQEVLGASKRVLRDLLKCQTERYLKVEGIGPKLPR